MTVLTRRAAALVYAVDHGVPRYFLPSAEHQHQDPLIGRVRSCSFHDQENDLQVIVVLQGLVDREDEAPARGEVLPGLRLRDEHPARHR